MSKDLIIGSHLSLSSPNYFLNTVKEAIDYNETTFMFYTGAPQNSIRTPLDKLKIDEGFKLLEGTNINIKNVVVHAPYIINLASAKDFVAKKSIETLNNELNRTSAFKVPNIVLHPGSHADWTLEDGMQQLIKYLNSVFEMNKTDVVVCLETMAGHKNEIGKTFEEIAYIIEHIKDKARIGVCLDTCHINDAGYDISDVDGVLDEFDKIISLKYLRVIHLNDSKNVRGSHKDRHENIGYGTLGFENILKRAYSERLAHLPKILETPYFEGKPPYKTEIEIIRKKTFFDFKNLANLNLFFQ